MKRNTLKDLINEKFNTHGEFAKAIGMTEATLSRRLNNVCEWRASEVLKAIKVLNIPLDEAEAYFFNPRVTKI